MILADTGYFIAIANPKDHLHRRAVDWTLKLQQTVLVTEYVLVETVNAMSTHSLRSRCREVMRQRQLHEALSHDHHFVQAGFDALLQHDPS